MIHKTLYRFDPITFEYVGKIETSQPQHMHESKYTDIAPPTLAYGKIYKFDTITQKWSTSTAKGANIANTRDVYKRVVDNMAEQFRSTYMTTGASQTMIYDEKYTEALDFAAKKYPDDLSDFPYIRAGVAALEQSAESIAKEILARRGYCMAKNAKVEEYRLHTKLNIQKSTKRSNIESIVSGFNDLLLSIE